MPPVAAALATAEGIAALIGGGASVAGSVIGAKSVSGSTKRATAAQQAAAAKAEAFERQRDIEERADAARLEAEERRRWDVDQQNLVADRTERDQRQRMLDARQNYEDQIRFQKQIRLAELTGGQRPQAPPPFGLGSSGMYSPDPLMSAAPGAPIMSRPGTANAMITPPGQFDPFADPSSAGPMSFPLNTLSRRKVPYVA